jgi:hypothetical protein
MMQALDATKRKAITTPMIHMIASIHGDVWGQGAPFRAPCN